ncbi:MAG: DUF6446 family protein [Albimonas sp.]|uniref:DUF6446 family protein n=1 Tax=Albimonas sp. TaxID=1872425 RepID=UPI0040575CF1
MSGRVLTLGLVFFALVFGAALWWFQTRAYYAPIEGVEEIVVAGVPIPVEDWEGIDADTSPLKLRACFRLALDPPPALLAAAGDPAAAEATPLVAPDWFDCFDAPAVTQALAEGRARAALAERNSPWGFDRFVAFEPETRRGWMWRQLNECGQATFDGDPAPEGCGAPPED